MNPAILLADVYNEDKVQHIRCRWKLVAHYVDQVRTHFFGQPNFRRKPRPKTISMVVENTKGIYFDAPTVHCLKRYHKSKVRCFWCKEHTTAYVCDSCIPAHTGFCNQHTNKDGRNCFELFHITHMPWDGYQNNCYRNHRG